MTAKQVPQSLKKVAVEELKGNKKSDFSLFFQFENVSKKRVFPLHTLEKERKKERKKKERKEKYKQRKTHKRNTTINLGELSILFLD